MLLQIFGMDFYYNIINYLFPVLIYKDTNALTIEDRRPSNIQLIFAAGGIGLLVFALYSAGMLIGTGYYSLLALLIAGAILLIFAAVLKPFREMYNFDKTTDTYVFVRRGMLKSETEEGSLSQFRAVQVERRLVSGEGGIEENYHVALLKTSELLFGSPPVLILREGDSHPVFSSFSSETRIAKAITDFLDLPPAEVIDV